VADWAKLEARQQQGLIKHWYKELDNFADQLQILRGL
jgi:hypothetical protein